jgi:archaetidylinositol phosphate synthase
MIMKTPSAATARDEVARSASPHRVQANVVAQMERRLLDWLCATMPASVQPDHLTLVGIAGAALVFFGYVLGNVAVGFVTLASLGFVVHWFGDSLDGSLARWRKTERPRYGYFVDHGLDAYCNFFICLGIGLGPYVRLDIGLFVLAGYLLLTIYVVLKDKAVGSFQLSFHGLGPTELRLILIALNTIMVMAGPLDLGLSFRFSVYDLLLLVGGCIFILVFTVQFTRQALALRHDGR